jgi:hypothetical protein
VRSIEAPPPKPDPVDAVAAEVERTNRSVAPELERVTKYGAPTYQGRGDVGTIGVWTRFVAVGFWNGPKLAAGHPMLEAASPTQRVAKLRTLSEARSPDFRSLVRDTAKLDRSEPAHPR